MTKTEIDEHLRNIQIDFANLAKKEGIPILKILAFRIGMARKEVENFLLKQV